ncbi:MAG: gas vesicle protein [Chloroflexi bacterium]|nr:gas vesicle protein [Chloroflexota bacterium]
MSEIKVDSEKFEQATAAVDALTRLADSLTAPHAPPHKVSEVVMSEAVAPKKVARKSLTGAQIVAKAKEELVALTGLSAGTVSGLSKDEQGWHVILDMIELKRIPESSDVLANYDVVMDGEGNLVSYQRTRRYYRGAADAEH